MKTCENCKKVFEDDMKYCPYCGTKFHDYKDDLKQAMDDLFEEKEVVEEKTIISRVKKHELLREEKTNDLLNKLLGVIIVLIIGTMLVGAVMIGEKFLPSPIGIVEDTNPTNEDIVENDENTNVDNKDETVIDEIDQNDESIVDDQNVGEVIDITNIEDGDFFIEEIKVKKENDQVKIEVKCNALMAGNAFLKDDGNLDIGPINVKEGKNEFYFLVNGQTNYKLYFDASNGRDYEYSITKDMIQNVLNEN